MVLRQQIQILIVEDNPSFLHLLEILLAQIDVAKYRFATSYDTAIQQYHVEEPDLCILDIELDHPEKDGIKLAEYLREKNPLMPIIFLTSHYDEAHYQKALHTRPSGFISKELSRFKLMIAIDSALLAYEKIRENARSAQPELEDKPLIISNNHFFFKIGDLYKSIPVKEIKYFYADNKLTYARVANRNFPTNVQLKVLEDEFQGYFVRIHKTYLVNIDFIESIHPKEGSITIGGESLPIGYAYRKPFMDRLKLLR